MQGPLLPAPKGQHAQHRALGSPEIVAEEDGPVPADRPAPEQSAQPISQGERRRLQQKRGASSRPRGRCVQTPHQTPGATETKIRKHKMTHDTRHVWWAQRSSQTKVVLVELNAEGRRRRRGGGSPGAARGSGHRAGPQLPKPPHTAGRPRAASEAGPESCRHHRLGCASRTGQGARRPSHRSLGFGTQGPRAWDLGPTLLRLATPGAQGAYALEAKVVSGPSGLRKPCLQLSALELVRLMDPPARAQQPLPTAEGLGQATHH